MTVHLVSVGVSILDAMKSANPNKLDDTLRAAFSHDATFETTTFGFTTSERDAASRWAASVLSESGHDDARARQLRDIAAAIDVRHWPDRISAETQTCRQASDSGRAFPLHRDDIAVLICSDTPKGLLAGVWNALALTRGTFARIIYLPEPGMHVPDARGKVLLARVTGMDAASSSGFRQAMKGLGDLACGLFTSGCLRKEDDFRFYLSGGFKAAIPYLIGMAEAVKSLDKKRLDELGAGKLKRDGEVFPVKAFVLHDMTDPPRPIELPLRRLPTSSIREELARYTGTTRIGKPRPALLDGYAYEVARDGSTCTLTPFGEGLRTLFAVPPEGYGG